MLRAEKAYQRAEERIKKFKSAPLVHTDIDISRAEAALQRRDVEKARGYATVVTTLFESSPFAKRAEEILKSNLEEVQ